MSEKDNCKYCVINFEELRKNRIKASENVNNMKRAAEIALMLNINRNLYKKGEIPEKVYIGVMEKLTIEQAACL